MAYKVDRRGNHHDGGNGRFIRKNAAGGQAAPTPAPQQRSAAQSPALPKGKRELKPAQQRTQAQLQAMPDRRFEEAWKKLAAGPERPGKTEALAAFDMEFARREVEDDDSSDEVRRLIRRGETFAQAHARLYQPSEQEKAGAFLDAHKLPGENRRKTLSRLYLEHIFAESLDAEAATRGRLLSPAGLAHNQRAAHARGRSRLRTIRPEDLWTMPDDRAARYASEELKAFWQDRGGRTTYARFAEPYVGSAKARRRAEASRQAGAGRDYGV